MRLLIHLLVLLACVNGICLAAESASPAPAQAKSPNEADYFKVEIRGTLTLNPHQFELLDVQGIDLSASVLGTGLAFGEHKDLAARAKSLEGKKVLVRGYLQSWSPRTAARSNIVVNYVLVTELDAVKDAKAGGASPTTVPAERK